MAAEGLTYGLCCAREDTAMKEELAASDVPLPTLANFYSTSCLYIRATKDPVYSMIDDCTDLKYRLPRRALR